MLTIDIPGYQTLQLDHLVLDFNGTLACDGQLIAGVRQRLERLAEQLQVHIITADTFGGVAAAVADIPCRLSIIPPKAQDQAKLDYLQQLGASRAAAIGNGRNDRLMLAGAGLGIAVMQEEGAASATILAADLVTRDILAALDLLLHPGRLVATLRN